MTEAWDPAPQPGQIDFALIPASSVLSSVQKFRLVNRARNNAELGWLTLMPEESDHLMKLISPSVEDASYQQYITERLNNPQNYAVNGRMLNTMSTPEALQLLNTFWQQNKPVLQVKEVNYTGVRT